MDELTIKLVLGKNQLILHNIQDIIALLNKID